ncbi:hypothetical protein H0H92_006284 [Tricholoma furcatifolium]|nr:hypothetical protein H0H92_006284 [Tricholoma furcatifolium]
MSKTSVRSSSRLAAVRVKEEDDYSDALNNSNLTTGGSSSQIFYDACRVWKLGGDKPVYYRPEGQWVDEENDIVYFYYQDINYGPYRLTSLSLKTKKWTENKRLKMIVNSRNLLSKEVIEPLPPLRGAADAFGMINNHRVIILFGGMNLDGNPTSDLCIIHLDKARWWKVDFTSDEVQPRARVDASMTFINDRLYIFGGRHHESYSIAEYAPNGKWRWTACDEPYPSPVPKFGFCGMVHAVYGGTHILLIPGCMDVNLSPPHNDLDASHVVLFDVSQRTFQVYEDVTGEFPTNIYGMNSCVISQDRIFNGRLLKAEDDSSETSHPCCAILIATWHEDGGGDGSDDETGSNSSLLNDMPELWVLNLSAAGKAECTRVDIQDKLATLGAPNIACCDAFPDRRIVLLGTSSDVPNQQVFDRCIEIAL